MTKTEKRKQIILERLATIPILSTEQIARLFQEHGSPGKRASEILLQLVQDKLIEGKRREIGKSKVWRLTKKGRERLKVNRQPVPLNSRRLDHILAVGDCYQALLEMGGLQYFRAELRERFELGGRQKVYAPDAFFVYKGRAYVLEVQITPIPSKRWAEKWALAAAYYEGGYHHKASFQIVKGKVIRPRIVALSTQQADTIQAGSRLPIQIVKSITQIATG